MNPIVTLILQSIPGIIGIIQARHAAVNPDAPPISAEQVVAAFEEAFTSTVLKDQMIRARLDSQG